MPSVIIVGVGPGIGTAVAIARQDRGAGLVELLTAWQDRVTSRR